jgi:hypothetical protein
MQEQEYKVASVEKENCSLSPGLASSRRELATRNEMVI